MDEKIILNDRDFEIFKVVNKFGIVEKKILAEYFSDQTTKMINKAVLKRLRKLERAGYLKSYTRSYGLGVKGKNELILSGINLEYSEDIRKEYIKKTFNISTIILNLRYKYKMSRIEFINYEKSKNRNIQNIKLFAGVVWNKEEEKYLVYSIDELNKGDCKKIKKDLMNSRIKNVILITKDFTKLLNLDKELKEIMTDKLLLLPNNEKYSILLENYESGKLSNSNLASYIKNATNQPVYVQPTTIRFNNTYCTNQLIFDYNQFIQDVLSLRSKGEDHITFIFEESYSPYFKALKSMEDSFEIKNDISITLEKFLNHICK